MTRPAKTALLAFAVALLAAGPYFVGGVNSNFILLDDNSYVYENPKVRQGLTPQTVLWAFTSTEHANWHPLTWISHMFDVSLFGLNARGHHVTSILIHALSAALLFLALARLTGRTGPAAFVAAFFGLHPMHVESVAWISERKDVLAGLFFMLVLLTYERYARREGAGRYSAVLLCCALGLMAKPVLVTLPFVLLLLDVWPLARMSQPGTPPWRIAAPLLGRRLLEKAPLFLLAATSSALTIVAHRQVELLHGVTETLPFGIRLANAALSYCRYLGKMIWPTNLSVFYPHLGPALPMGKAALAGLFLAALTALLLLSARRRPWLAAGWLWYAGTLVPMIGLVSFGGQAMADRYTYLPSIGFFLALVWSIVEDLPASLRRPAVLGPLAGAALAMLSATAAIQASYWRDSATLFTQSIAATRENWMMHFMLALAREEDGQFEEAKAHYLETLRIMPNDDEAHINLGILSAREGRFAEAIAHYLEAIRLRPRNPLAYNNLANVYYQQGHFEQAIPIYRETIRLRPSYAEAHANLGMAFAATGRHDKAVIHYRESLRLLPGDLELERLLAISLAALGRSAETISHPPANRR